METWQVQWPLKQEITIAKQEQTCDFDRQPRVHVQPECFIMTCIMCKKLDSSVKMIPFVVLCHFLSNFARSNVCPNFPEVCQNSIFISLFSNRSSSQNSSPVKFARSSNAAAQAAKLPVPGERAGAPLGPAQRPPARELLHALPVAEVRGEALHLSWI